jgi:hypothetical protein
MKINYKYTTIILSVLVITLTSVVAVLAGNTDPPSGPTDAGSQMYTLEQIYNRLTTGAWQTKMTAFTEPVSGPGATGRTLDEVMAVARPGALAPRVNKTGQTDCWNFSGTPIACTGTGQDGDYQRGIDPAIAPANGYTGGYNTPAWTGVRFTDNGNGTVTDNLTGLIWLKNANCWGTETWANALSNANGLANGSCGLTDGSSAGNWRLPNVNELHSLIDLTESNPALPSGHPFTGVQSFTYWSSTTYAPIPFGAWYVRLSNGLVGYGDKTFSLYVWPVRGGQ